MNADADIPLALACGSHVQHAAIPPAWNVHTLGTVPESSGRSEREIVSDILENPVAGSSLASFLTPGDAVLILVSDKTRRCRTALFLPILLERIHTAGIPPSHVRILFATGTHPGQSEAEQREILGDLVFDAYEVFEHDARDAACCALVGTTAAGTPIEINRLVLEADKVIATGTIVHHYFAGFGGGAKLFVPGVASYATAVANHRRTITEDGRFHPGCADGKVEGNPVIADIMDALGLMPPAWYFAAILDERGRIADGVCGDLLTAHAIGCRKVEARYGVPVRERADITLVSTGGYPKDINFIQAHKSLHHAHYVTKEGGVIVLLAECREGIGNAQFLDWFDYADRETFRRALLERYAMNAHTALAVKEKTDRFHVILVSALDDSVISRMGMHPAASLEEAVRMAAELLPDRPLAYILENGSLIVPRLHDGADHTQETQP